ncbi:hypothetical protein QE152_g34985 [Popillia japonica]|uniref:Uncharacterized protein n=1 Tax=Popillia japonica TaxID=7064 RepID=A0AAW1ISG4_POPJA
MLNTGRQEDIEMYRNQKNTTKSVYRRVKTEYYGKQTQNIEAKNSEGTKQTRTLYCKNNEGKQNIEAKNSEGTKQTRTLYCKNNEGKLVGDEKEISETWTLSTTLFNVVRDGDSKT